MNIKQGEVWLVNFDPSVGSEIQKKRPCIVVNDDRVGRFGIKIVVPITTWKDYYVDYLWIVKIPLNGDTGLTKTSGAECFQIKSFSEKRFIKKIGVISTNLTKEIHSTILKTLNPYYGLEN
ncbi:type II toxin-antitoxin system PemK/MazF family toxin [Sulfurospirillum sp. 1307]